MCHPLHDGVFCELVGALLLFPTVPIILCCLLTSGWVVIQARLEERDLKQRIPEYQGYMQRVPRFLPRVGKA